MTEVTWPDLLRQGGGKWFLNPLPWWWAGPVWIVLSVLATQNQQGAPGLLSLFLWNTIAVAFAVGLLALLGKTFYRNRVTHPVPVWQMLLVGAGAGATKFVVFSLGMSLTSHFLPNNDLWRLISLSLVGALIVPGLAVVYTFRENLVTLRQLLVRENLRSYLATTSTPGQSRDKDLEAFINSARKRVGSALNAHQLAVELENIIDSDLKPLTKRLWKAAEGSVASLGSWDLFLVAMKSHQFSLLPSLVLYIVSFSIVQISAVGWPEGLGRIVLQSAILILVMWASNKLPQRSALYGLVIFVGTNLTVAILITLVTNSIFDQLPYLPPEPAVLVLTAFFLGINLVLGILKAALAGQAQLMSALRDIENQREAKQLNKSRSHFVQRELAQHLHSRVQNQMLNSAVRLNNQTGQELDSYKAELEFIEMVLDELTNYAVFSKAETLEVACTRAVQQWQGLVKFSLKHDLPLDLPNSAVKSLTLVINEALTNAVRHGGADTVEIHLSKSTKNSGDVLLECIANGRAPTKVNPGLGFELYDALSDGDWSLDSGVHGGGSVLRVGVKSPVG